MKGKVKIIGLQNIPLIEPGDDLAALIYKASKERHLRLANGDIVVVSQKVVSKAEGRLRTLSKVKPTIRARSIAARTGKDPRLIQLVIANSDRVLRADSNALIVRRRDGFICVNSGIDKSNVKGGLTYALLPRDADASAEHIRHRLQGLTRRRIGVIVADTYSRPVRVGQVEHAIGVSGIDPIADYRRSKDLFGYRLHYKYVAVADEVAAAAELVMGQGDEATPVAIVKGVPRLKMSRERGLSRKLLLRRQADLFHGIV